MKTLKKPELFIQDRESSLGNLERKKVKEKNASKATSFFFLVLLGGLMMGGVGGYYLVQMNNNSPKKLGEESENFSIVSSTSSTTSTVLSTTTTSTSTTSSTIKLTTTTSSTTTTISCGGDWEKPCKTEEGEKCNVGNVLGSEGLCHTPECAPSVPSGKEGCGGFALQFCQGKKK